MGDIQRFAEANKILLWRAKKELQRDLAYTLHRPRQKRFPTVLVVVGNIDQQWVADLVEVQPLSKYNQGLRYLLTVIDILSKHAWVEPLKDKTGLAIQQAFEKILKKGKRKPQQLQTG